MSNIKQLRAIIEAFEIEDNTEALDILSDIESDISDLEDKIRDKNKEISDLEDEVSYNDLTESAFLGLDTLHYRLEKGNIKVQSQVESFIAALQKQNVVVPT